MAAGLDYETTASYALTVEASDGRGGTDTAPVTVAVTDMAEDPPPAPMGLTAGLADGVFSLEWSAVDGAGKYEAQHTTDADDAATVTWTALPEVAAASQTYAPAGGPECGTTYRFRVRAYGDGETYAEVWGAESAAETEETRPCNEPPAFDEEEYAFAVSEDAEVDDVVGAVSATDPNEDDAVTYAVTAGNGDGKFAIDGETGAITVAAALDRETADEYSLTVQADDGNGGTDTAPVTVTVAAATCSGGIAVPDPSDNPGLVSDCETLLGLQDALAGAGTLDWGFGAAMTSWDGVTVGGSPKRVTELDLPSRGLTGSIPAALSGLDGLQRLVLKSNGLTGGIPADLGDLSNLLELDLHANGLTGGIPTELGDLSNLVGLWLHGNELTGGIPTELGSLSDLVWLALSDNQLTGPIPPDLGGLGQLSQLWLRGNELDGELPRELGNLTNLIIVQIEDNDLTGPIPPEFGQSGERFDTEAGREPAGGLPAAVVAEHRRQRLCRPRSAVLRGGRPCACARRSERGPGGGDVYGELDGGRRS